MYCLVDKIILVKQSIFMVLTLCFTKSRGFFNLCFRKETNMKKTIQLEMATMTTLPLPVTLVTSISKDNIPNIAVVTYVTGVNEQPPMFGIALRPQKYSNSLIKQTKEFVINIPTKEILKEVDYCGTYTGRNIRKFEKLKLTPEKAQKVKTPLIAECPVNIECRLRQIIKLPSHDFFIGEAVALHIEKNFISRKKNKYSVLLPEFKNLHFLFTTFLDYRLIGKKMGTAFEEQQKLNIVTEKTVKKGRTVCQ